MSVVPEERQRRLVIDGTKSQIVRLFGENGFTPNWKHSGNFKGENLNLARQFYDDHPNEDFVWWQIHIRGWVRDDGLFEVSAHYEPHPIQHPHEHMEGTGLQDANNAIESIIREDPKVNIVGEKNAE